MERSIPYAPPRKPTAPAPPLTSLPPEPKPPADSPLLDAAPNGTRSNAAAPADPASPPLPAAPLLAPPGVPHGTPSAAAASALVVAGHRHLEHVSLRLRLLLTWLRHTGGSLAFGPLEALWGALVDGALCAEEAEQFFQWLDQSRLPGPPKRGGGARVLDPDTQRALIERLLCDPARSRCLGSMMALR